MNLRSGEIADSRNSTVSSDRPLTEDMCNTSHQLSEPGCFVLGQEFFFLLTLIMSLSPISLCSRIIRRSGPGGMPATPYEWGAFLHHVHLRAVPFSDPASFTIVSLADAGTTPELFDAAPRSINNSHVGCYLVYPVAIVHSPWQWDGAQVPEADVH
jgi:hypothetical protein